MKHTVTLTQEELLAAARYFYNIPPQAEIVVAGAKPQDDGWISNVGRSDTGHPDSLRPKTMIEIKYRCGRRAAGYAADWNSAWCEIDGNEYDIAAYRVVK